MIITIEYFQLILLALAIFLACWPIYRKLNRRYWVIALPYAFMFLNSFLRNDADWHVIDEVAPSQ